MDSPLDAPGPWSCPVHLASGGPAVSPGLGRGVRRHSGFRRGVFGADRFQDASASTRGVPETADSPGASHGAFSHGAFLRAPGRETVFGHRRGEHGAIQGSRFPDHRLTCSRDGSNQRSLSGGPRRRTQARDGISDPQWQQLSPSRGCDPVEPNGFSFWRRDFRWWQVRGRHPGTCGCRVGGPAHR